MEFLTWIWRRWKPASCCSTQTSQRLHNKRKTTSCSPKSWMQLLGDHSSGQRTVYWYTLRCLNLSLRVQGRFSNVVFMAERLWTNGAMQQRTNANWFQGDGKRGRNIGLQDTAETNPRWWDRGSETRKEVPVTETTSIKWEVIKQLNT